MDKIKVVGGRPLKGTVEISGAKNSALPCMAAALLAEGPQRFSHVPNLADVRTMQKLVTSMGAKCEYDATRKVMIVDGAGTNKPEAPYDLVRTMRASVLVLGPLMARFRRAKVSLPGGCSIGSRPVDFHIEGLKKLGAEIDLVEGYIHAKAAKLHGAKVVFPVSSVTGAENILMAAVLAEGESVLENAAREPEVVELVKLLRAMGARIEGEGTSTIRVQGVKGLKPVDWEVIPDRIESGTFALAAAMTQGDLLLENCRPSHLSALLEKICAAGARIEEEENRLRVIGCDARMAGRTRSATDGSGGCGRPESVDVTTDPYPGFATDMQAQFMAWMAVGKGSSIIAERVFAQRFIHVSELRRMGAQITVTGSQAMVKGVPALVGAEVMATDLRASACLILAGLIARGTTTVHRVYHLDRGYETIEKKLRAVGATIDRVS